MGILRKIIAYFLGLILLFLIVAARPQEHEPVSVQQEQEITTEVPEATHVEGESAFAPGEFIFDHIGDSYEWHILSYNNFHLTIPLPVIVFSKEKGLNIFLFSKFRHGHSDFNGFRFEREGENRLKVVEILQDGTTARPAVDLSFTKNAFAALIAISLMLWVFLSVTKSYNTRKGKAPQGLQNLVEPFIIFIRDEVALPSIGRQKYERFLPYLLTVFFFIWINNMMGLIPIFPGGANVTGNITITAMLAGFTFFITTLSGNRNYWQHIFNPPGVPWWLKFPLPLMPLIEFLGILIKPCVLAVRLFANISAGHIIALGFFSLIFIFGQMQVYLGFAVSPLTLAFTIFMSMLELLVALIQAYVFTLLSSLYFGMATVEHHEHKEHKSTE
jgi:F-type H+-transporting ATPase subunit a